MKKLRIGLVGLPNVGKSSLFKLISKKQVLIANYPFSTINSNSALVNFYDRRVIELGNFFKSQKISFDSYELVDIAGIVKGASQKIGLGGEFLSKIRSVDLIFHVVRCFKNDSVIHVEENVNPIQDIDTVYIEFISSDVQQIEKRLEKLVKILKKENKKKFLQEKIILEKINDQMKKGILVNKLELTEEEKKIINSYNLLTNKPSVIIANYNFGSPDMLRKLQENYKNEKIIPIDIGLEIEYEGFSSQEKEKLNYHSFNLQNFSMVIINKLQLKSFFTAGKSESRNWIIDLEANATECAGLIHSDIKNRLIRAKVYHIDEINSWSISQRKEPISYIIKDGEVCDFLFN